MIKIGKLTIKKTQKCAMLFAPIEISRDTAKKYAEITRSIENCKFLTESDYPPAAWENEDSGLYFSVSEEYGKYLSTDDEDAAHFISVCFNDAKNGVNCGECFGCRKR